MKSTSRKNNILICVFAFVMLIFISIVFVESRDTVHTSHDRSRINNPNAFIKNCYINEEYVAYKLPDVISSGAYYFYEKTGIQFYMCHIDVTNVDNVSTSDDLYAYCKNWVKENIPNHEYSIVFYDSNSIKLYDENAGYDISTSVYNCWYFGDKTKDIMDSNGTDIVKSYWEKDTHGWYYDKADRVLKRIADELMGYVQHMIIKIVIINIILIAIIFIIVFKVLSKKHEADLEILNTPIDIIDDSISDMYL